jgi:hypothetical protein
VGAYDPLLELLLLLLLAEAPKPPRDAVLLLVLLLVLLNPLLRLLDPPTNTMCEVPRNREAEPGEGDGEGEGEGELPSPQSVAFFWASDSAGATVFRHPPSVATTAAPVMRSGTSDELLRRGGGGATWRALESAGGFTEGGKGLGTNSGRGAPADIHSWLVRRTGQDSRR